MKLSLSLEMVFPERPFAERMRAAARLGYPAVEFWDWKNKDQNGLPRLARDLGLEISAFSGNRQFTLTDPADRAGLLEELQRSLDAARHWNCRHLMLLADRLLEDGSAAPLPESLSDQDKTDSIIESLARAAEIARGSGVALVLEPLNTKLDHPRYFLDSSTLGFEIVRRVNAPEARLLYDVYHMSMMGEDAVAALESGFPWLGYVHAADMPGRHEPGSGTIDYARVFSTLRRLGYQGAIGLEFSPSGDSETAVRKALQRCGAAF
jgi:hydroxypyruvate isomerase